MARKPCKDRILADEAIKVVILDLPAPADKGKKIRTKSPKQIYGDIIVKVVVSLSKPTVRLCYHEVIFPCYSTQDCRRPADFSTRKSRKVEIHDLRRPLSSVQVNFAKLFGMLLEIRPTRKDTPDLIFQAGSRRSK
jgi:hypothetical protein